jgi:phosphoserine phosphatase RsbX
MDTTQVTEMHSDELHFLNWSGVVTPHPDETVCGDAFIVRQTENGAFLCLIDGLGHGREAYLATNRACSVINDFQNENILLLIAQCHEELKNTRGVVMSVVFVSRSDNTIEWAGIGNVEGVLLKGNNHEWLPLRGGIVGCRLPSLRSSTLAIQPNDMIVMYTDGITHSTMAKMIERQPCDQLAYSIMSSQAKGTDDAAVLVARYKG